MLFRSMLVAVIYLPFANDIFDTVPLTLFQWEEIIPLLLVPSIAAEVVKYLMLNRGRQPDAVQGG